MICPVLIVVDTDIYTEFLYVFNISYDLLHEPLYHLPCINYPV